MWDGPKTQYNTHKYLLTKAAIYNDLVEEELFYEGWITFELVYEENIDAK